MPYVITTRTGKPRYMLSLGDTIQVEDTRGRRAAFELMNVMEITNDFALLVVDKAGCERDEDGWTPGVESMQPLDDEEFLVGGEYLVLRRVPSRSERSTVTIPSARPRRTHTSARRKKKMSRPRKR